MDRQNETLECLRTPRLMLQRFVESDFEPLHVMHSDERVMKTLGGVQDHAQNRALLADLTAHWVAHEFGWWAARSLDDGRFLGRGGLRRVHVCGEDEVEVGYGLVVDAWGQGLASEIAMASIWVAFERLRLDALVSFTLPDNLGSRNVMEKCGFSFDRDFVYKGWPHVLYRLSAEAWQASSSAQAPRPVFVSS
jgi:ribosomal-protein-alanine N-acetyltransferase